MPTPVLGSLIFEVIPTVQSSGSSGGDPLMVSDNNTIPAVLGGAGVPSGTPQYGTGELYVDTTNIVLYYWNGTSWTAFTPVSTAYVASLAAGTGIGVSGSSGAITVSNTGVTSLAGTANEIIASAATGAVTLSLSQPSASITAAIGPINTSETVLQKLLVGATPVAGDSYVVEIFGTCTATAANASTFFVRVGTAGTTADTPIGSATTGVIQITSAAGGSVIPFYVCLHITFRTATSVIASGVCVNNGITGISAGTTGNTVAIAAATAITNANNFITITYKTAGTTTTSTFQLVTISKVR